MFRLTESGLSITKWDPITGIKPPRTPEEWEHAFDLYKASPEYRYLERDLDMNGFKFIYYMEWGHRNWGRLIGNEILGSNTSLPAKFGILTDFCRLQRIRLYLLHIRYRNGVSASRAVFR